jgi:hypothetical protein
MMKKTVCLRRAFLRRLPSGKLTWVRARFFGTKNAERAWGTCVLNPELQAIADELSGRAYLAPKFPSLSPFLRPYRHPKDTLQ